MSLIKIPDITTVKNNCEPTNVKLGFNIDPILNCGSLTDLSWADYRTKPFQSDFACVTTILTNVDVIQLVHDKVADKYLWWGFFKGGQKLYKNSANKHERPVLFR